MSFEHNWESQAVNDVNLVFVLDVPGLLMPSFLHLSSSSTLSWSKLDFVMGWEIEHRNLFFSH